MTTEGTQIAETSFTYVALVRLLSRRHHLVPLEVAGMIETLATNLARVGLFPRVNTMMVLEVGIQSEPLLADFAFKRSFPYMGCYNYYLR